MATNGERVDFFRDICTLIEMLRAENIELMPTCFYRTQREQEVLFAQGKSKTLHSRHSDWMAIDFVLIKNNQLVWKDSPEYQRAGELWKTMLHTWGGDWESLGDIYHFEF